mgnify:CR=1 FL=1
MICLRNLGPLTVLNDGRSMCPCSLRFLFFSFNTVFLIALICRHEKLLGVKADLDPFRFWASPNLVKQQIQNLTDYGKAPF